MNRKRVFTWGAVLVLVLIAVLVSIRVVAAQTEPDSINKDIFSQSPNMSSASYNLNWDVMANSSGVMTSTSYLLQSTLGQNAIGTSSSVSYSLHAGFWQLLKNYLYLPIIQH